MDYISKIDETIAFLRNKLPEKKAEIGVVIGSGLGKFADNVEKIFEISYADIPNFPESGVVGHSSSLIIGKIADKNIVLFSGRKHIYEGADPKEVVFFVRVFAKLGLKKLIVTNAAGGINTNFSIGDLMLITDHINFSFRNPLIGKNLNQWGPRFPDMCKVYDPELRKIALECAVNEQIDLKQGVYVSTMGPAYETAAEIQMLKFAGCDAVAMSTVPEVITAIHSHIKVLGISFIANMAAGLGSEKLSHKEVIDNAKLVEDKFSRLITAIVKRI